MTSSQKNFERPDSSASKPGRSSSGITMPRILFARVDRLVKQLNLASRGQFMLTAATEILNMCEGKQRVLPALVARYDQLSKPQKGKLNIDKPREAQRCGTHFRPEIAERIDSVVKRIGWSRNQFIGEAMKTVVDMCEDPNKRTLPLVVILHDAIKDPPPLLPSR